MTDHHPSEWPGSEHDSGRKESLDTLAGFWRGGFEPLPIQRPANGSSVAGHWPNPRPVRRAAHWTAS
jgi:hypothetical protein